jgi:integrase
MILMAFRHRFRAAELVALEWSQVDFAAAAVLHVRQVKNVPRPPLRGDEFARPTPAAREGAASPFVFISERGAPFATAGFAKLIERAGTAAGFDF